MLNSLPWVTPRLLKSHYVNSSTVPHEVETPCSFSVSQHGPEQTRKLKNTAFFPDVLPGVTAKYDVHVSLTTEGTQIYKVLSYTCKHSCMLGLSRTLTCPYVQQRAFSQSLNTLYLWISEWLVSLKAYLLSEPRVRAHVQRKEHFPHSLH